MADAEDYAGKGLDILGGLGGAIVGVVGGGSEGAKGVQVGVGAIKDLVGMATGSSERKRAEASGRDSERERADREQAKRELDLREREIALREREQKTRDRVRDFDAPMYTARRRPSETRGWQPSELREGDRIVDVIDTAEKPSPPLTNDARDSVLLRRGDSRDVLLVDAGPLIDGAHAPTSAAASAPASSPPTLHSAPPTDARFEPAGYAPTLHNADAALAARIGIDTERLSKEGHS